MFNVIQISVVGGLISKVEPIWFIGFVDRRRIIRDRNMVLEEYPWHLGQKLWINYHLSRIEGCWCSCIVWPVEWIFVAVGKDEGGRYPRVAGQSVDTLDNRIRSREFDKTVAFDDKPRREIEETVGALDVSRGTKANSRQAARLHTVRRSIVLVDFAIKSKRGKAMAFYIQLIMLKNLARAESVRDTIRCREIIEPHNHMMKKIDEHNSRDLSIRKSADDVATMLLDNPDPAFNFTNVFRSRCSIQCSCT